MNIHFLEAYKELDKLCRDIYRDDKGVTNYIEDMKSKNAFQTKSVARWNDDLQQLQKSRHLRNSLGHDVGTLEKNLCTQRDIDWITDFKARILNGTDPLTMLRKSTQKAPIVNATQKQAQTQTQTQAQTQTQTQTQAQNNQTRINYTYVPLDIRTPNKKQKRKRICGALENIFTLILILAMAFVIAAIGYALTN